MKKSFILLAAVVFSTFGFSQTATNFNVNDCQSVNHDLFSELDAGKVIVITWVMPCSACIGVASSVATTVQGYAVSDPGRVKFYLVDDYANSTCSTLMSWASTNGISTDATFSNAAINMSDYGTPGMQKTIILGGTNHMVFYNQVGAVTVSTMQAAIDQALLTGIAFNSNTILGMNVFPNPTNGNSTTLNFNLIENSDVYISIYNEMGEVVKSISLENQSLGKHQIAIDLTSLSNGVYFAKLIADQNSEKIRFIIAH